MIVIKFIGLLFIFYCTTSADSSTDCINAWKSAPLGLKQSDEIRKKLTNVFSKQSSLKTEDTRYTFSACQDPSGGVQSASKGGIWDASLKVNIGAISNATIEFGNSSSWTVIRLSKADACSIKVGTATLEYKHSSLILFTCDSNQLMPKISHVDSDAEDSACSHVFVIYSAEMCDSAKTTVQPFTVAVPVQHTTDNVHLTTMIQEQHNHSGVRGVGLFFMVVSLTLLAYFAVGCAYKRYVLGARGIEQLPNYSIWVRIARALQLPFMNANGSAYDPSSRYRRDFRYDQPPLLADDGDDSDCQDIGVMSAANATSDVRLLIV